MASTTAAPSAYPDLTRDRASIGSRTAAIPWYIWCAALAVTSAVIGANWDISWHMSIGRDTFWTPAHKAIYLCGVLAGVAFGYIILSTTWSKTSPLSDVSVHIWGFRAPLGAFIASWGGIMMLTSAPFDSWWHDAYGLDVKIISPPHILLFMGVYGVLLGTLVLIAGHMNRSTGSTRRVSQSLLLHGCGMMLIMLMTMLMEYLDRIHLHTSLPYVVLAAFAPIMLSAARATGLRFAATLTAGIYTVFNVGLIWILPLFPAEPKLGPVYQHVTHFIPEAFPILLIVPALALDLLWERIKGWNAWQIAILSSIVFVAVMVLAEWPFASFLMSPAARNRVFGAMYLWYGLPQNTYSAQYMFWNNESTGEFWRGMLLAVFFGVLSFRFGLSRAEWLRNIKR
ncbi:MAG: hypothetical protein M3Y72_19750 [Acidobacteriota bacterium]|nr:hypothetical protein [Acidobacteriota bacterium]